MNFSLFRRIAGHLLMWSCVSIFIIGLNSCGGSGPDNNETIGPAPLTMNGLVLTLYASGVELTFIRAEGDASIPGGVETGAVTMKVNPAETTTVNSAGTPTPLRPSYSISGGRYTYIRTGPEAGSVSVAGEGSGFFGTNAPTLGTPRATYFQGGTFIRNYEILFGTNGTSITGIDVNDWGEGSTYPGISWNGATLRVFGGTLVSNAWSLADSALVNLPKLYPPAVSAQQMTTTPTDPLESSFRYEFLTSTFTRFSEAKGDFIEEGVGRSQVIPEPVLTIINYDYQPDPATTNRAIIRIYNSTGPVVIYNMTFLDLEKGTYVREDGSAGTFEFPFLN